MTTDDIITALESGSFTADDLRQINVATKLAYCRAQQNAKQSFSVGDRVQFTSSSGVQCVGTITKILQKNVKVHVDGVRSGSTIWRVSPSLLSRVQDHH